MSLPRWPKRWEFVRKSLKGLGQRAIPKIRISKIAIIVAKIVVITITVVIITVVILIAIGDHVGCIPPSPSTTSFHLPSVEGNCRNLGVLGP